MVFVVNRMAPTAVWFTTRGERAVVFALSVLIFYKFKKLVFVVFTVSCVALKLFVSFAVSLFLFLLYKLVTSGHAAGFYRMMKEDL